MSLRIQTRRVGSVCSSHRWCFRFSVGFQREERLRRNDRIRDEDENTRADGVSLRSAHRPEASFIANLRIFDSDGDIMRSAFLGRCLLTCEAYLSSFMKYQSREVQKHGQFNLSSHDRIEKNVEFPAIFHRRRFPRILEFTKKSWQAWPR